MTCIVALVERGITYVAGDSLVVTVPSQFYSNVNQTVRRETKVFKKNGLLLGASGSVRMNQLLRYEFVIPEYISGQDKVKYLVSDFIKALQSCFAQANFEEDELGGNILLALEGELFTIGNKFNVCNTADNYDAIGKASDVAIGSLHTTAQLDLSPQERLHLALKAAEHHTCVVSSPFLYITDEMDRAEVLPI